MTTSPRIVSLIPSATEIVDYLGLATALVGRSHECDSPVSVQTLPVCTEPKFDPVGRSSEIHDRVTLLLQSALSVYRVKTEVLEALSPTHILTQAQCEVCAVNLADVEAAIATLTTTQPQIISLQPLTLRDVWEDMERVAAALGVTADLTPLQQRVNDCATKTQVIPEGDRPTVVCIEWAEPLMAAGNWVPELVELAGGRSRLAQVGKHSPWLTWETLLDADPDILVIMPCGFDLARTRQDAEVLSQHPQWRTLTAVKTGRVYLTDGNQYFNRPGPRLVDSLEILAEIIHPAQFQFDYEGKGWCRFLG